MKQIFYSIAQACSNVKQHKTRSILASLGMIIGSACITTLMYVGNLASHEMLNQINNIGPDNLYLSYKQRKDNITTEEVYEKIESSPAIKDLKSLVNISILDAETSFKDQNIPAEVVAITEEYFDISHIKLQKGRLLNPNDQTTQHCLISEQIAEQIEEIGAVGLIGQLIGINHHYCEVVGVIEPNYGNWMLNSNPNSIYLLPESIRKMGYELRLSTSIFAFEPGDIYKNKVAVSHWLLEHVPEVGYRIQIAKEGIEMAANMAKTMQSLLSLIGGIALLIGGIGVMNIMLVSVLERKKELGIRMALGANRKNICNMVLQEAFMLSIMSTVVGVSIGIIAVYMITLVTYWKFVWILSPIAYGSLTTLSVGIISGYYPARNASKLDPIQAMTQV